jgi:demethoxyubiquinone hydroxylase (CLK1/Coq7/Cat5 family)
MTANMPPAANDTFRRLRSMMCSSAARPQRVRLAICFSGPQQLDLSELAHAVVAALLRNSRGERAAQNLGNGDTALAASSRARDAIELE